MADRLPLVLVIEDEESDVFILRRAFQKARLEPPLVFVKDGREAVKYLAGDAPYSDRGRHPLPALLLLDLKMPGMTGFEVLQWMASRPELSSIVVIVLSSSAAEADADRARELGAREYHVKPIDLGAYSRLVQGLGSRWLGAGAG